MIVAVRYPAIPFIKKLKQIITFHLFHTWELGRRMKSPVASRHFKFWLFIAFVYRMKFFFCECNSFNYSCSDFHLFRGWKILKSIKFTVFVHYERDGFNKVFQFCPSIRLIFTYDKKMDFFRFDFIIFWSYYWSNEAYQFPKIHFNSRSRL